MVKKICSCFMLFLFSAILGFRAYADTPGTVTVTAPENGLYLDVYEVSDIADTDPENKSGVEWISDYIEDNNIAPDYSIESEGNRWILRDLPNGFYYLNLENDDYEMLPITFSMPQADENGKLLSFFEVYPKFDEPGGNNGSHSSSGGSSSNGGWSGGGAYDPDADAENGPGGVKEEESEPETSALPVGGDDSGSSGNGENLSNMDGLNNSQAGGGLIGQLQDMIHGTLSDTGDHADPMLYLLLMAVSMTGIIVTVNFGRKRKKQ